MMAALRPASFGATLPALRGRVQPDAPLRQLPGSALSKPRRSEPPCGIEVRVWPNASWDRRSSE